MNSLASAGLSRDLLRKALTVLCSAALLLGGAAGSAAAPSAVRQLELRHLLWQDCGSCHGLRMKGGLGPALTPAALAGKETEGLVATIIHGRPGSAMPPWSRFLDEPEARWLVDLLMKGDIDE